jgi:hypothetical protein
VPVAKHRFAFGVRVEGGTRGSGRLVDLILLDTLLSKSSLESGIDEA